MRQFLIPLVFVPLAFSYSTALADAGLSCEVLASVAPTGMHLEAVVHGRPGTAGSYQLTVEKYGAGGSTDVRQGGEFLLDASGSAAVAVSDFNLDGGVRVLMRVASGSHVVRCAPHAAAL